MVDEHLVEAGVDLGEPAGGGGGLKAEHGNDTDSGAIRRAGLRSARWPRPAPADRQMLLIHDDQAAVQQILRFRSRVSWL